MNVNTDTTAATDAATDTRTVCDAIDILCRAIRLNELIFEAAHHLDDSAVRGAFVEGSDIVDNFLKDAKAAHYANVRSGGGMV